MSNPQSGIAYSFSLPLVDAAARPSFKAAPTLATGDVKISKDDGAFVNLTTLSVVSPAGGTNVLTSLSATEMTITNHAVVAFSDQSTPKEWDDVHYSIELDEIPALINALNDVAATDIVSAGPITTLAGAVANVDLVDTCTSNTDMRGTDNAALASVCTEARLAELDAVNLPTDVAAVKTVADGIQTDLSNATDGLGALKILIDNVKAETALILADTNELQTDNVPGLIAALNNVAATDIVSAGAITTLAGAVVNVDLVDTCTSNTDMRGTDGANTTVPPTVVQIRQEIDTNSTQLAALIAAVAAVDTTVGALPSVSDILTTTMVESYAANGVVPSLAACLFEIRALLATMQRAGVNVTTKKIDGVTTAATYIFDDALDPASLTRVT